LAGCSGEPGNQPTTRLIEVPHTLIDSSEVNMAKAHYRTLAIDLRSPNEGKPRLAKSWVNIDEYHWQEYLKVVDEKPHTPDEIFVRAMKAVLWGAFYVEARINSRCRDIVERLVKEQTAADMISVMVRCARINEKISFLGKHYGADAKSLKRIRKCVARLFGVRNKLVHADREAVEFLAPPDIDEENALDLLDLAPNNESFDKLVGPDFKKLMADITNLRDWLMFLSDNMPKKGR